MIFDRFDLKCDGINVSKMNDEYYKCLSLIKTMNIKSVDSTYRYITLWKIKWHSKNKLRTNFLGFHCWDEYYSNMNYINNCFDTLENELNNQNIILIKKLA